MTSYFVYYRVAAQPEAVRAKAGALLDRVERSTGIAGRLLHRTDGSATWMEIYEGVADPVRFEAALGEAVEATGFAELLGGDGRRHVERFAPA